LVNSHVGKILFLGMRVPEHAVPLAAANDDAIFGAGQSRRAQKIRRARFDGDFHAAPAGFQQIAPDARAHFVIAVLAADELQRVRRRMAVLFVLRRVRQSLWLGAPVALVALQIIHFFADAVPGNGRLAALFQDARFFLGPLLAVVIVDVAAGAVAAGGARLLRLLEHFDQPGVIVFVVHVISHICHRLDTKEPQPSIDNGGMGQCITT
jgi:hypothetical protein